MNEILIRIDWIYFLGLIGSFIAIAWYSGSRFTKVETDVKWIKDIVKSLKINSDNKEVKAFASKSPVSLTEVGNALLAESGMKAYLDASSNELLALCEESKSRNPYEIQQYIFKMFNDLAFPNETDDSIKKYAFEKGVSEDIVRRIGAIYLRDICLRRFDIRVEEIDEHAPLVAST